MLILHFPSRGRIKKNLILLKKKMHPYSVLFDNVTSKDQEATVPTLLEIFILKLF